MNRWRRWIALVLLSASFALLLDLIGLPAGLLLGAMLAGIVVATRGAAPQLPPRLFIAGQALIGCLIAGSITPGLIGTLANDWLLFVAVTATTIIVSGGLGYMLARLRVVPGTVAIWGSMPGGAAAMVVLADAHGADARLVAVMVYTRVMLVALTASILAALFVDIDVRAVPKSHFLDFEVIDVATTIALAATGAAVGWALRLPAGALVCTILIGAALNVGGVVQLAPPQPLLVCAYAIVGWRIGLGFTRETVRVAARALPGIAASAVLLILVAGGLALLVARELGIDPVTAFLAASPGGMDSVAIVAASIHADVPLVMAFQMIRFVLVLLIGPTFTKALARRRPADAYPPA